MDDTTPDSCLRLVEITRDFVKWSEDLILCRVVNSNSIVQHVFFFSVMMN